MSAAPASRTLALRCLWSAARQLEDGEAVIREHVRRLNERDGTNAGARGTPEYSSTRKLSDRQFSELLDVVAGLTGRTPQAFRPRGPRGGRPRRESGGRATYLVTPAERTYVTYLLDLLEWSPGARDKFIARQTRGAGIRTHRDASAVIEPLERMCRAKGHVLDESQRVKRWRAPAAAGAGA